MASNAFVLGGGGLLGVAEAGMARALLVKGVVPDMIFGTSVGRSMAPPWPPIRGRSFVLRRSCGPMIVGSDDGVDYASVMAVPHVRACGVADREQALGLFAAAFPARAGELRTWSQTSWHRFVAVVGEPGPVVAYGAVWPFRVDGYRMDLVVSPSWRRRGVGSMMLARAVRQARARGAVTLQARADDGWTDALAFLGAHGFVETMRMHRQALDVAAATLGHAAGLESRLAGLGVGITTLAGEVVSEPLCWAKFRDLHGAAELGWVDPDPRPVADPPVSVSEFRRMHERAVDSHGVGMAECLLAVQGDRYVGFTGVLGTGVHPDCRGRGIATALKARWVARARDHGVPTLTTASGNPAMLHINHRLGYRVTSTEIRLVKPLRSITDR